jgi:uncharacterized glyoxalase superfamily protein PhnB
VLSNRSILSVTTIPVLIYPDVRAAVSWLSEAFGFVERLQIGQDHRSQMNVGEGGAVIIGDVRDERVAPRPGEVTHSVLVRVENAKAHCEHARAHGALILQEPPTICTASGSTAPRIPGGTGGCSRKRWPTSTLGTGAAFSAREFSKHALAGVGYRRDGERLKG